MFSRIKNLYATVESFVVDAFNALVTKVKAFFNKEEKPVSAEAGSETAEEKSEAETLDEEAMVLVEEFEAAVAAKSIPEDFADRMGLYNARYLAFMNKHLGDSEMSEVIESISEAYMSFTNIANIIGNEFLDDDPVVNYRRSLNRYFGETK